MLKYSTLNVMTTESSKAFSRNHESNDIFPNSSWLLENSSSVIDVSVAYIGRFTYLLVSSDSGNYCMYNVVDGREGYKFLTLGCNSYNLSGQVHDVILEKCELFSEKLCAFVLSDDSDTLVMTLSYFQLPFERNLVAVTLRASTPISAVVIAGDFGSDSPIASARIARGSQNFFLFFSFQDFIYGAVLTDVMSNKTLFPSWKLIGAGRNLGISFGFGDLIMLVSDFGFCYNSHKHNTRSTEKICSSLPHPSKNVMDYSVASENDWLVHLAADSSDLSSFVTPCHHRIMHGSYDQGSRPSISLSMLSAYFLELHEGLSQDEFSSGGCGNPLHRDGIILDSFPIKEWMLNLDSKDIS